MLTQIWIFSIKDLSEVAIFREEGNHIEVFKREQNASIAKLGQKDCQSESICYIWNSMKTNTFVKKRANEFQKEVSNE